MHSYSELRKVAVIGKNHADLINKVAVDYQRIAAKHIIRVDYLNNFSPSHNLCVGKSFATSSFLAPSG